MEYRPSWSEADSEAARYVLSMSQPSCTQTFRGQANFRERQGTQGYSREGTLAGSTGVGGALEMGWASPTPKILRSPSICATRCKPYCDRNANRNVSHAAVKGPCSSTAERAAPGRQATDGRRIPEVRVGWRCASAASLSADGRIVSRGCAERGVVLRAGVPGGSKTAIRWLQCGAVRARRALWPSPQ